MADSNDSDSPVARFLRRYLLDRLAGRRRDLADYLREFSGDAAGIAAEYARLREGESASGADAADLSGSSPPSAEDPAGSDPRTGARPRVGPYVVEAELGRGGQAVVYRAYDPRLDRRVALKVLDRAGALGEKVVARFRREALLASKLDHPGVCPVYEAGVADGLSYIAMRLVDGETLAKRIARASRPAAETPGSVVDLDDSTGTAARPSTTVVDPTSAVGRAAVREAARLFARIARALHVVHEAGIIHRDLKPGNLMITAEGDPLIMDFGLARDDDAEAPDLTESGDLFGTPAYMSPEQLTRRTIRLDRRTDVWSLGVALYETLTLRRPFDAPTRTALYQEILTREPPSPRRLNPAIGRDLETVVVTALQKDRERRYATALAVAEDLERVLAGEPVRARPPTPWIRASRWAARNPAVASALTALVATLAIATAVSTSAWRRARDAGLELSLANDNLRARGEIAEARARADLLVAEAAGFDPTEAGDGPKLEAWIVRARREAAELPRYAAEATSLRAGALATDGSDASGSAVLRRLTTAFAEVRSLEGAAAASRPDAPRRLRALRAEIAAAETDLRRRAPPRFADSSTAARHQALTGLVDVLAGFVDDDAYAAASIAGVERRARLAARLANAARDVSAWDAARAYAATDRRYGGLRLSAAEGLVALGPDPRSGLLEFGDVRTGDPPRRGPDGRLELDEGSGLVFVLVPAGEFAMGAQKERPDLPNYDPDATQLEGPPHAVMLSAFLLSKYEMSQGQWFRATGKRPSFFDAGDRIVDRGTRRDLLPVESVTADAADAALATLRMTLPTEAQWERACRAGTSSRFGVGDDPGDVEGAANVLDLSAAAYRSADPGLVASFDDGWKEIAEIGRFEANAFGFHDLLGNVAEWTADAVEAYAVPTAPGDGLRRLGLASERQVFRGNTFNGHPRYSRVSLRFYNLRTYAENRLGVRPVKPFDR